MSAPPDLYLASKSPRRRELLAKAGLRFALIEPGEEYAPGSSEHESEVGDPLQLCAQRARRKAEGASNAAQSLDPGVPVLAVDTVVDLDGSELGKAADRAAAETFLRRLAGKEHRVHTAHCLRTPGSDGTLFEEVASAVVTCAVPTPEQLARYLDSEQWRGKAGAYGIQDPAQDFLKLARGAFDTVVGLHLDAVRRLLRAAGECA